MKLSDKNIKSLLFYILLALLWLPIIQAKFKLIDFSPLKGVVETIDDPYLTKSTWKSGEYQEQEENYLKHNFGFRTPLIRLYNQKQFAFYKKANANSVLVGRENYLYEENYIKAALGLDFLGEDSIRNQVQKLKLIADSLEKKQVKLVVLLAPGKSKFLSGIYIKRI